jgi:predicted nucleic acid-binding protein
MGQYLIDNNVISSYFSELFSEKGMDFIADIIDQVPNISVITEIEALSWINPTAGKEKIIQEFINDANILSLTPAIVKQCVLIRRSKKIKTPDAIIVATAVIHNLSIITSDSDFNNIFGLSVVNPQTI